MPPARVAGGHYTHPIGGSGLKIRVGTSWCGLALVTGGSNCRKIVWVWVYKLGYALLHQITRARSVHVPCDRAES
jgi:hypothetical protein